MKSGLVSGVLLHELPSEGQLAPFEISDMPVQAVGLPRDAFAILRREVQPPRPVEAEAEIAEASLTEWDRLIGYVVSLRDAGILSDAKFDDLSDRLRRRD